MTRQRHASGHPAEPADGSRLAAGRVAEAAPPGRLERITLAHTAVLLVGTTWAFGGQAEWVRTPISLLASLGVLITLAAVRDRDARRGGWLRPLAWAWPVLAFNVYVLLGCLNPSFRVIHFGSELGYANVGGRPGFPSVVRPDLALAALWRFDVLWLAGFNLTLVVRQRRALRWLLTVAVANAAALAVFGTVQKLSHAKGIYFDAVATRQPYFFASFVYHNHWGAFMLLMMACCLGLIWHHGRGRSAWEFSHTPAFAGLVVLLALAVTVPLSGSRSSSLLTAGLLGAAFLLWVIKLVRSRRRHGESTVRPVVGALVALVLAVGATWWVARESIVARYRKTQEQIGEMRAHGTVGDRAQLYTNTWRMAKDKLWYGWGMASYPQVFSQFYNTRKPVDRLPIFYQEAHSDWLQAVAEHGLVGSTLLVLSVAIPLLRLRAHHFSSPVPAHLLAGCALILLYAWIEFPLANVAVVLCWWLCFFSAVQYARLQDRDAGPPAAGNPPPAVHS